MASSVHGYWENHQGNVIFPQKPPSGEWRLPLEVVNTRRPVLSARTGFPTSSDSAGTPKDPSGGPQGPADSFFSAREEMVLNAAHSLSQRPIVLSQEKVSSVPTGGADLAPRSIIHQLCVWTLEPPLSTYP